MIQIVSIVAAGKAVGHRRRRPAVPFGRITDGHRLASREVSPIPPALQFGEGKDKLSITLQTSRTDPPQCLCSQPNPLGDKAAGRQHQLGCTRIWQRLGGMHGLKFVQQDL
jgi:hypothetical protein